MNKITKAATRKEFTNGLLTAEIHQILADAIHPDGGPVVSVALDVLWTALNVLGPEGLPQPATSTVATPLKRYIESQGPYCNKARSALQKMSVPYTGDPKLGGQAMNGGHPQNPGVEALTSEGNRGNPSGIDVRLRRHYQPTA